MFKLQQFAVPSALTLHYHIGATNTNENSMINKDSTLIQRERSLSPDSLEQRLLKHHQLISDELDDEESLLTSSSSFMDSISIEQSTRPSHPSKTILKSLTTRGLVGTFSYSNENVAAFNDDDQDDDDDFDDDFNEIHFDQDEVNFLFSDPDDGAFGRFSNESLDVDEDYDDNEQNNEEFPSHIRPLPLNQSSESIFSSSLVFPEPQLQYSTFHFLDPISEAASEEERRAAISILRQQQQKHKHSTSSSLSIGGNGHVDGDTTLNDDLSTLSDCLDEEDTSMDENSISQSSSIYHDQHIHKKRRRHRKGHRSIQWITKIEPVDNSGAPDDTLERLRNITKMFTNKGQEDEAEQHLKKVEKIAPSDKMRNTFQKFEEIASSNGQHDDDDEEDETETTESDGIIRSSRKKKAHREHVPFHEMAEKKEKFEKGQMDSEKPKVEKRLDVRVQSGLASSKKQAFEQGEFEQEVEPHVNKFQIDTDLVAGVASSKKQAFEQNQLENESHLTKTVVIDRDAMAGATTEKKAKFEKGEFNQEVHDVGSNRVQADADLLVGATTDKKAKFETGQVSDRATTPTRRDDILTAVESGSTQAKRSELLSKFESEREVQRSGDRHVDIDREQHLASERRDQLEQLAQSEYKSADKHIDVTTGLANTIKEQYMADTSKAPSPKPTATPVTVESGLTKSRATAFEHPDEGPIKRTVEIDNELRERGVAKERVAMFKNLESGAQPSTGGAAGDSKIRVDRVEFSDTLVNMSVRLKIKSTDSDKNLLSTASGEVH